MPRHYRAFGEVGFWICPVCDHNNPGGGRCTNCGLDEDATEKEVEEHRLAYVRAPDEVRERFRMRQRKRELFERNGLLMAVVLIIIALLSFCQAG